MKETFALDTSGAVAGPVTYPMGAAMRGMIRWPDLSPFAQGYVEAMFASLPDEEFWQGGFGFSDLAPETLAAILRDCEVFVSFLTGEYDDATMRMMGREFWRARNGAADAFMAWPLNRPALIERSRAFPPLTPSLGDDGRVYLKEKTQ